ARPRALEDRNAVGNSTGGRSRLCRGLPVTHVLLDERSPARSLVNACPALRAGSALPTHFSRYATISGRDSTHHRPAPPATQSRANVHAPHAAQHRPGSVLHERSE